MLEQSVQTFLDYAMPGVTWLPEQPAGRVQYYQHAKRWPFTAKEQDAMEKLGFFPALRY